jgi:hypothetical protein
MFRTPVPLGPTMNRPGESSVPPLMLNTAPFAPSELPILIQASPPLVGVIP